MNICIIPARGGSKRIPRKNIKIFFGKPIIYWSIRAAKEAKIFDEIIVSTDDQEIANISREFGASVPFFRPLDISGDFASLQLVMKHAINWLQNNGVCSKSLCCLLATAPFVLADDLRDSYRMLVKYPNNKFIVSGCKFPSPIQRALLMDPKTGFMKMYDPRNFTKRSQDLEDSFFDAGQFYWASTRTWLEKDNIFEESQLFRLPEWRVVDIDTNEDWERAELMKKTIESFLK